MGAFTQLCTPAADTFIHPTRQFFPCQVIKYHWISLAWKHKLVVIKAVDVQICATGRMLGGAEHQLTLTGDSKVLLGKLAGDDLC